MNSLSTIARVLTDGRHPIGLGYERPDAELVHRLRAMNVRAQLYSGKLEGSITELIRHLARMRSETVLLTVGPASAPVAATLARGLRELRPMTRLAFVAPRLEAIYERLGLAELGTLVEAAGTDAVLASGLWGHATGGERTISLYREGILQLADLGRIGIRARDTAIEDDLAWIVEQRRVDLPVLIDAEGAAVDETGAIIARLAERLGPRAVTVQLPTSALEPALVEAWPAEAIAGVVALTEDGVRYEAKDVATAAQWAAAGQLVGGLERAATVARNGLIANYTGIYPHSSQTASLIHLDLPAPMPADRRRAAYAWAGPHMAAKSAAVVHGPIDAVEPLLDGFTQHRLSETGGWPSHVYAVAEGTDGAGWFDGEAATRFPLQKLGYRAFLAGEADSAAVTVVALSAADDVAALEAQLERMHATGKVTIPARGAGVYFENSCRWLSYGSCPLATLRRLQLDAAGDVTACRDAGRLGDTTKPVDKMVVEVRQAQQIEQGRRGCAACPVRDACSRCTYLPGDWAGRYCEIRITNPATALFFELHLVADLLGRFLGTPGEELALTVSATGLPLRHMPGVAIDGVRARPVIITSGAQHIAWQRGTSRFVRLSAALATILEGRSTGASEKAIAAELAARFGVGTTEAADALGKGCDKLTAVGLIDG